MSGPVPARSYVSGVAAAPLLGDTIGDHLTRAAAVHGDSDALVDRPSGRRWTYRELVTEVDAVAQGLLGAGIGKGDRVGIWAANCPEWVFVQYACATVGAVLVNLDPAYGTRELDFVLRKAGVRLLVSGVEYRGTDCAAVLEEVRVGCPGLERVLVIGGDAWTALCSAGRLADPGLLAVRRAGLCPDDPINIQFTSGTTGFPKGATLTHHNILNNGYSVGQLLRYTEADRVCVPVPFFHCFGMVMANLAAMTHGACIVIPSALFDARAVLVAVAEERCTSLYGVPTMFIAELAVPDVADFDLSSLRTGIMSGSPCPVEVMTRIVERMGMTEVTICYGMTETSPVATQTRPDDGLERRVSTVGTAGPHVEIKVVDPATGLIVARGERGEVCMRGYSVMRGYWDEPERTAEAIDPGGWMHSGDIGAMDAAGYLAITGRIKDMVIRGGENLYPREIEEFLHTHPDVLDVAVVGVPDPWCGEELVAWVRMREGAAALDAERVRAFCLGALARHKIPRYVRVVDEFPMTVSGKVRKVELRERAVALLTG